MWQILVFNRDVQMWAGLLLAENLRKEKQQFEESGWRRATLGDRRWRGEGRVTQMSQGEKEKPATRRGRSC